MTATDRPATVRETIYRHVVAEGTPDEVGQALGRVVRGIPGYAEFMSAPFMGRPPLSTREIDAARAFFERYHPGLNDEIAGFARAIGVSAERVVYHYAYIQPPASGCSQFAVLPGATADGRVYLARNYDFTWDDVPILCTTRVRGQYAHTGFAIQAFGRAEGMNERGLAISTSAGIIMANTTDPGGKFCFVVRAVLARCATVDEALDLIADMPVSDCRDFLLADRLGNAALVEVDCACRQVARIGPETTRQFLCSTNHYALSEMLSRNRSVPWHSVARHEALVAGLDAAAPRIGRNSIRGLLAAPAPRGVLCEQYSRGMGTMWAALFEPISGKTEVCFGSPGANDWRSIDLWGPPGLAEHRATLPDREPPSTFFATMNEPVA
jgi:hypothetical protein